MRGSGSEKNVKYGTYNLEINKSVETTDNTYK